VGLNVDPSFATTADVEPIETGLARSQDRAGR
jgi:hypothetical protein